jgi:hypothetical protein
MRNGSYYLRYEQKQGLKEGAVWKHCLKKLTSSLAQRT